MIITNNNETIVLSCSISEAAAIHTALTLMDWSSMGVSTVQDRNEIERMLNDYKRFTNELKSKLPKE